MTARLPRGGGVLARRDPVAGGADSLTVLSETPNEEQVATGMTRPNSPATLGPLPDMDVYERRPRGDVPRLYAAHFDAVLGFALRRVDRPEDAADVTADTFLVAWRRLAHAPQRPRAAAVAVRRRAPRARQPPTRRAAPQRAGRPAAPRAERPPCPDTSDDVVQRADVTAAMQRLSARDQEVLELHLWEGLESREIAEVLGLTADGRAAPALPGPDPAARAARQRSRPARTSPPDTPSSPGRSPDDPRSSPTTRSRRLPAARAGGPSSWRRS